MTDKKTPRASLASELDQTQWDYQPRKDRKFLLAPLSRLLGSVVWEFRPKHLRPASVRDNPEIETEPIEEVEAAQRENAVVPEENR